MPAGTVPGANHYPARPPTINAWRAGPIIALAGVIVTCAMISEPDCGLIGGGAADRRNNGDNSNQP